MDETLELRDKLNDHAINAWEYGTIPLYSVARERKNFKIYQGDQVMSALYETIREKLFKLTDGVVETTTNPSSMKNIIFSGGSFEAVNRFAIDQNNVWINGLINSSRGSGWGCSFGWGCSSG